MRGIGAPEIVIDNGNRHTRDPIAALEPAAVEQAVAMGTPIPDETIIDWYSDDQWPSHQFRPAPDMQNGPRP
jgi:hypothetical protein